jgi:uncharacterized membrane protein YfcA
MTIIASLVIVVFFAIFVQAVSGSGLALIAMPLLTPLMGPLTTAALVALISQAVQLFMLTRYHRNVQYRALWRLVVGSLLGIPLGVFILANLDSRIILVILGLILFGYAVYGLLVAALPEMKDQRLGYLFGFVSGVLGGAYNTGGPPYVIYGVSQRWEPAEYKGNLQVLFTVNSTLVVITHWVTGHFTETVWLYLAIALPVIVVAALIGFRMDKYINSIWFRRIVLILLLVIGVKMLLP